MNVSSVAIASARDRVPDVRFECRELPEDFPPGRFELIVFSEVLYYLNPAALGEMLDAVDIRHSPEASLRSTGAASDPGSSSLEPKCTSASHIASDTSAFGDDPPLPARSFRSRSSVANVPPVQMPVGSR